MWRIPRNVPLAKTNSIRSLATLNPETEKLHHDWIPGDRQGDPAGLAEQGADSGGLGYENQ